jgi:nucleotide sugar dehydrogenase
MKITVVAMGKIGLPLAVQFASRGHSVIGTDIDRNTIDLINQGIEPFPGEAHLREKLATVVGSGLLVATDDTVSAVSESEAVIVVVPLFVDADGTPNFEWMDAATASIGKGLTAGTLVSYETTLPVGTTRNRFSKMLENESGLIAGVDFHLAFSPERVFTGRVFEDLRRYPKLVGGINKASGEAATKFYESVLDFDDRFDLVKPNGVWDLGSSEASELAKLAETTYRDVNIGLANQFAQFADTNGIDIYQVIEACNSQKFSQIHQPGIAVGGHCIPIYPQMFLWNDPDATIVRAAREANLSMPSYAVRVLERHHGSLVGEDVVVLGASYRGGVKETAFSGVFPIVKELQARGAVVSVHDPMYSTSELQKLGLTPYTYGVRVDAGVLHTDHSEYKSITAEDLPSIRTILDGRNVLAQGQVRGALICKLGVDVKYDLE